MKIVGNSIALLFLFLTACSNGGTEPTRGDLVSASFIVNYSASAITSATDNYFGVTATYGVNNYKIVYKTVDADGNLIDASGLLSIPAKDPAGASPLLVYDHGTIFEDAAAPTNSVTGDTLSSIIASQDYIVMMPDYVGYASSGQLLHPYLHASTLASASVDMIRASKTYLGGQSVPFNNKLFITGYSEGGYAAMAAHKEIQTKLGGELTVTASMPAGGPYDMTGTANHFLGSADLVFSPNITFVIKAYDTIYALGRIADIFKAGYVDAVNTKFYGDYNDAAILASLTNVTADLFKAQFLTDFNGSGETSLKQKLAENDIYDWAPVNPLFLYHASNDTYVPTANANTAETAMTANSGNVTKQLCSTGAGDHGDCFVPYISAMLTYFGGF